MITKFSAVFRVFGLTAVAGALVAGSPSVPSASKPVRLQAAQQLRMAETVSPNTFHHWPKSAATETAAFDPNTFHHWPHVLLADLDPFTFHHWG